MSTRDLLEVADELLGGLKEAHWRSAVSRAYYAAFHEARRLLGQCGFPAPKGEQAHAYLWLRLSNCGREQPADQPQTTLRRERTEAGRLLGDHILVAGKFDRQVYGRRSRHSIPPLL